MSSKKMKTLKEERETVEEIDPAASSLPEEFVIENILTRLPVRTLSRWSCISKLWYNTIYNDTQFAKTHFSNSKDRKLNLFLDVYNVWGNRRKVCYMSLENDEDKYRLFMFMTTALPQLGEPVGYCNGFVCVTSVRKLTHGGRALMMVVNPVRGETLTIPFFQPTNGDYLCHGLGYDSLSEEYKIVIILTSKHNKEFITMVFTLGTKSWRNIVTSVAEISTPPGCSPFPSRMVTKPWGGIRPPATICGDNLFWRITNSQVEEDDEMVINNNQYEFHYNNDKIGMLLSFDIHKEKIQFIRLPAECNLIATPTTDMVVEHHLLEYKGYPCVALFDKAMGSGGIHHGRPRCNTQTSLCCCHFTFQLYILQDKEKQVWIKGESFRVQVNELGLCCYFDTITAATASFSPRILSVSDEVLLYLVDRDRLKLYSFQRKRLQVVGSSSGGFRCRDIFENKMKGPPPGTGTDEYCAEDKMYCPSLDYQLHAQVENILSLKTFVPAGETRTFYQYDEHCKFVDSKDGYLAAGWLGTMRKLVKVHSF